MTKIKLFLLVGTALLFCSPSAMAREFADIYTDCGLGAMIAPKNSAVAAVTNVTWDSGTTAISSNISSPDTCKGGQDRAAMLIHQSYASLEKDIASGSGEYLTALVDLTGVDPVSLRKDFANIVADPKYSSKSQFEKSEALYNLVYKTS